MGKSKSAPKMHHILILSSSSIHFSSFPLLIAAVEEVPEEGEGAEERERDVQGEELKLARKGGVGKGLSP